MNKKVYKISPSTEEILKKMGEQIRNARLGRNLTTDLAAERAGISRTTLWKVECGSPSVAMGIYAVVLHALGDLDNELIQICQDDELGRQIQDLSLINEARRRAGPKRKTDKTR